MYGKVHSMPKPGFKSITISEAVYDKFNQAYQKNKDELTMKGVNSFAGYVTYLLEDVMKKDKTSPTLLAPLNYIHTLIETTY